MFAHSGCRADSRRGGWRFLHVRHGLPQDQHGGCAEHQPVLRGDDSPPSLLEIFHVGTSPNAYTWQKTGTPVSVGKGKKTVQVAPASQRCSRPWGAVDCRARSPGAPTNPIDMGTGGILAAQALALKINQGFSEVFVTPATGFSGLSFVNMDDVELDGAMLTPAQANALNGQATLQLRELPTRRSAEGRCPRPLLRAADGSDRPSERIVRRLRATLGVRGGAPLPALRDQQRIRREAASTVSTFAYKPTYNTFSGRGRLRRARLPADSVRCIVDTSYPAGFPVRQDRADRAGRVQLLPEGLGSAIAAARAAAIIFNSADQRRDAQRCRHPGPTIVKPWSAWVLAPRRRRSRFRRRSSSGRPDSCCGTARRRLTPSSSSDAGGRNVARPCREQSASADRISRGAKGIQPDPDCHGCDLCDSD